MISRNDLLNAVRSYYKENTTTKTYEPGDYIQYGGVYSDEEELLNLVDCALKFRLAGGAYMEQFEHDFAAFLGAKKCLLVNSGSSANLLAFFALTSPSLGEKRILRGDEVITVACGFPTTVAPIIQYGAVPVFVDITLPSYNIDTTRLEQAYTPRTKAVMLAHTLGNPFDLASVREFCDRHQLWLIEDNCDALGSRYTVDGETRFTGTWGDIGTSSFYPPHHMTMGEGGAVYTSNPLLYKILRSMRDWGRDCICPPGQDNICGHRFDRKFGELPLGYDHKYVYSQFGFNLKASEMQAAVGVAQIKKLPEIIRIRKENFKYLRENLACLEDRFVLPNPEANADPSWFGFPLTCQNGVSRNDIVAYLEANGVQTRNLFAGNLICHPCFDAFRGDEDIYRVSGSLQNTDIVMSNTFWFGVYPGMTYAKNDYIVKKLKAYFQ